MKSFDLASLTPAANLEALEIDRCPVLTNVDSLHLLQSLRHLQLGQVRQLPGWENLKLTDLLIHDSSAIPRMEARGLSKRPNWNVDSVE